MRAAGPPMLDGSGPRRYTEDMAPPIQYVRSGGASIAYQVVGDAATDILMIPGWISHLAMDWEEPTWTRWVGRITSFARLVRFDKRGTGLSDRPPGVPTLEERMHDALAVMNAVGLRRAHVLGWSEGGPLAILLAVTSPDRAQSLTLYGTQACFRLTPDYPWGMAAQTLEESLGRIEEEWGELALAWRFAPRGDERLGAADLGIQVVNLAGESVRRKPFDHRIGVEECAVDLLGGCSQHPVKPYGVRHHPLLSVGPATWRARAPHQ